MDTLHRILVFGLILYVNKENVDAAELFEEMVEDKAFVAIWNAPSYQCDVFGIKFDLSKFTISVNKNGTFRGNEMVIFYEKQLGLYPYLHRNGTPENWGLPQIAALHIDKHLEKVKSDVNKFIPDVNFRGLAVIDWEAWRPVFIRNGYNSQQKRYIAASKKLVRDQHPSWPEEWIDLVAAAEFEDGARLYMQETIELCKKLRPNGFWGFYGFPDCYNHAPGQRTCTAKTKKLNNRIWWLFDSSTAILPSIYIGENEGTHQQRFWNIHGELEEAIRLRGRYDDPYKPVIVYTRFVYRDTRHYYDIEDLRSTIAQTADFGLNGVVLWESSMTFNSKAMCEATSRYVNQTLGPFVFNETMSMKNCSKILCNMNGRCAKIEVTPSEEPSAEFSVFDGYTWLKNIFRFFFNSNTVEQMEVRRGNVSEFFCQCYEGWKGEHCERRKTSHAGDTLTFQRFKDTNTLK